jgi:hypothetical protein
MSIIETVCTVKGHNLQSLALKQIVEPSSKTVVTVHGILCTQCGKTLDEVLKYRVGGTGIQRRKKRKPANVSDSHQPIGNEAREDSVLEPVPGAPSGMPNL